MKRSFALLCSLWLLLFPVLAASEDDPVNLTENDGAAMVDFPDDSVEMTDAPPADVEDVENSVPSGPLGTLDLSGPIPIIVLPAESDVPEDIEEPSAVDDEPPQEDFDDDWDDSESDLVPDAPLSVIIVEEDPSFYVLPRVGSSPVILIGDDPPANPVFYGSGWVTGIDPSLGRVTIYFPITYKSGYLGVDRNGYLFNVSASSLSGYCSSVYSNSVTAPAFSYPRYRTSSSSGYYDLRLIPENSNMDIAVELVPRQTAEKLLPYILILFLGGVILCCMKRS